MSPPDPPCKILVVDDQDSNLKLLKQFLSDYKVYLANNGRDALIMAEDLLPDLILLDINMPALDGYQVCEHLKSHSVTFEIPVIFITGMSEPAQINRGFQVGAIDYITKPFSLSEIRARVQNQLDLKNARDLLKKKNIALETKIQEQAISSELARRVLQFINHSPARYTDLTNNLSLFVHLISLPCHDEGGDHSFVQTIPCCNSSKLRTVLSVKDQSGHSVNCILRSIATDLAHHNIIRKFPGIGIDESLTRLNNTILQGGIFEGDNFFTGISAEINHESLRFKYLSAGHPSIILLRDNEIILLPERGADGANIPVAFTDDVSYSSAAITLHPGDKLLIYTDGLTDISLETTGTVFTVDDLIDILKEINTSGFPVVTMVIDELLNELFNRCTSSGEDLSQFPDDITIMGVEVEPIPDDANIIFVKPSDYDSIDDCINNIINVLLNSLADHNCSIDENRITIPINESVLNTWKHGHDKDPDKDIGVRWWFGNDFNVEIISQGDGFAYQYYKNPISSANLTNESGRGLFLVKKECDYVRWRLGGKNIIMSFALVNSVWNNPAKQDAFPSYEMW